MKFIYLYINKRNIFQRSYLVVLFYTRAASWIAISTFNVLL